MHVFRVTSHSHAPLVVFAETKDAAANLAVIWQFFNGIEDAIFTVDWHWVRGLPADEKRELEESAGWGISGIGSKRPDGGWGIRAPRDEREGG